MDNEKLIKHVKNYKFLYDLSDKRYSDNQKKDIAWREISLKMKVPENDCKRAWALLRDAYRRAVKKQKEKRNGQTSGLYRQWKYEDEMTFLLPYFRERASASTTAAMKDEPNYHSDANLGDETAASYSEIPPDEESPENPSSPSSESSAEAETPPTKKKRTEFRDMKPVKEKTLSNALMAYILENKKSTDDIEQFFTGIATTVKSFPPRERAVAKAKVFEVVYKMEIEVLNKLSSTCEESVSIKGDPLKRN